MSSNQDETFDAYTFIPIEGVPDEVNNAMRLVADNFQRLSNSPVIPKRFFEPARKYDGLIVFADGVQWNPGFGRGIYVWDSAVDINGVVADGQLVGTIPVWDPVGSYVISFTAFDVDGIAPVGEEAFFSSNQGGNARSVVALTPLAESLFIHNSGDNNGEGLVQSTSISLSTINTISCRVNSALEQISITINGETFNGSFSNQYRGTPQFSTIFSDAVDGIADGIFMTQLVLNDVDGTDSRTYLLDDGISGTITDSGPNAQHGTWNNILPGNVITQQGAWRPLHNI